MLSNTNSNTTSDVTHQHNQLAFLKEHNVVATSKEEHSKDNTTTGNTKGKGLHGVPVCSL